MPNSQIESFVKDWTLQNVRSLPGLTNLTLEVDRLAADLTGAARAEGISGGDIHRAIGDIDSYLTEQYHHASQPKPAVPVSEAS